MSRAHSDGNGGLYIHRSSIEKWLAGIATVVIGGLLVTAITGNIVMYGRQQALLATVTELSKAVEVLARVDERRWDKNELTHEELKLAQDQIKNRLTRIDRQTR